MSVIENKLTLTKYNADSYTDSLLNQYNNNILRCSKKDVNVNSNNYISCYVFWSLVAILSILTLGNLILTCVILGVLRIGHGMQAIEFLSQDNVIKFFGFTDLDHIYKRDGYIKGFFKEPMEILGDGESMWIEIRNDAHKEESSIPTANARADFGQGYTFVRNVDEFEIKHPTKEETIYSSNAPRFKLARGMHSLHVYTASTHRISSPVDAALNIRSDTFIKLKGNEGTHMKGREIVWAADQDIFMKSVNRSVVLSGAQGVHLALDTIPIIGSEFSENSGKTIEYKLCVCMPSGWLYRIQAANCLTVPDPCNITF